jgi:hypothetical protein
VEREKDQYETSHERHCEKRCRLSHYYERKSRTDRKSQSLSVFDAFENVDDLFQPEKEIKDTGNDGMFLCIDFFIMLLIN